MNSKISAVTIISLLIFLGTVQGATIYVPDDYPTIQEAIDAASNGDTVLVDDGTYTGYQNRNLTWSGKVIKVRSENGPRQCVIDCQASGRGFYLHNYTVTGSQISGFAIINGNPGYVGGGIMCEGPDVMISNCIIANNYGWYGGGIYCMLSNSMISNCIICNNNADVSGGGVFSRECVLTIANCAIIGNSAYWGGGSQSSKGSPNFSNCTFSGNSADPGKGGAIRCGTGTVICNCILWGDTAEEILVHSMGTLTVSYSNIEGGKDGIIGGNLIWCEGNIDTDPLFVDQNTGDFHLLYPSRCRNAGDNSAVTELEDFEGDPRIAYGTVDMGADEFYTHLYYTGDATPNGAINVKAIGLPCEEVILNLGNGILDPPIATNYGDWHLQLPVIHFMLGSTSWKGMISLDARIPTACPTPLSVPLQALVRDELTNLCVLEIE